MDDTDGMEEGADSAQRQEAADALAQSRALFRQDRYEEALTAAERALALAPERADAGQVGEVAEIWLMKGIIFSCLQRYEEDLAAEERALDLAPNYGSAWHGKGNALYHLARFDAALAAYERALELGLHDAIIWHGKAAALWSLKRPGEALAAEERALELNSAYVLAWNGKGKALRVLDRHEEALAAFERALALDPAYVFAWNGKGNALVDLGRPEEALAAYERALELDPDDAFAWHGKANALYLLDRPAQALVAIERALAAGQETVSLWRRKAWCLEQMGNLDAAVTAYEEALRRAPAAAAVWRAKASVLYRLARYQEAADAAAEAVRLDPTESDGQAGSILRAVRRTTEDHRLQLPDGRWLGYLDYGDPQGTPILCCHGTPGSRLEFPDDEALLRRLRVRLVAPDRPGYGLSDDQPGRRILDWPADVAALAEHLGLARFAVLGVSGGGAYAAACAYALSERVTTVGLVSSAGPREMPGWFRTLGPNRRAYLLCRLLPWPALWRLFEVGAWARRADPAGSERVRERFLPVADAPRLGAAEPAPVVLERLAEPVRQGGRGEAWDMVLAGRRWGFPLQAITAEAYVWYGARDRLTPAAIGRYLVGALPRSQGICYPEEGHALFRAHWQDVLTALTSAAREGVPQGVPPSARDAD